MKNKSGITLVALVITIIILLILAGVAITTLTQTGLLAKTKQAKEITKNTQENEDVILKKYENKINEETINIKSNTRGEENTYDLLYEGELNLGDTKNLNYSIRNYKKIGIRYEHNEYEVGLMNYFNDFDFLKSNNSSYGIRVTQNTDNIQYYSNKVIYFPTDTKVTCFSSYCNGFNIVKIAIYGFGEY